MQDKIMPEGKWKFDKDVTAVFDNMLQRSIPQYEVMRELCFRIGKNFVVPKTYIADIGCSNGTAISPFIDEFGDNNNYTMLDVSDSMLTEAKRRFPQQKDNILKYDITQGLPEHNYSVILSILTIQFTPIEYRHKIIKSCYDLLCANGAFVFVEKVLGNTSKIDDVFVNEYYSIKRDHQYTQEQIQAKRKSLEGVLVPITSSWNIDLLKSAGFKQIDCFWRCLNFAGFIALK